LQRGGLALIVRLHMGRQFSYYAFPEDLAEIESDVFQRAGGRLLVASKRDARHYIEAVSSFPLALDHMGIETLGLLLSPPAHLENIVFSGVWLDTYRSHVIEVGRSYIKDGKIKTARFWYEPTPLVDGHFVEKPAEFLNWASQVFHCTKKLLTRHTYSRGAKEYKEWCGKFAKQEFISGRIAPY
jgi:hypothetical protein